MKKRGTVCIVANQKGGVGKSTTCFALMGEFAHTLGLKTLVIDYDPQGTLTDLLEIDPELLEEYRETSGIRNIFEHGKETGVIEMDNNMDFIPSDDELGEYFESAKMGKEKMLDRFLKTIKHEYDLVLIDTKPDLNTPLVSSFLAADIIINTIETGGIEEAATVKFYKKLDEVVDLYEKKLKHIFVIPTKVNRSRDAKEALLSIKNNLPELYLKRYKNLSDVPMQVLKHIPNRAVFPNSTGVKVPLRRYIEDFDTGKRDILLDLEKIAKKIWKGAKA